MPYKDYIGSMLDSYKCMGPADELKCIPIQSENGLVGYLCPITYQFALTNPEYPYLIYTWRSENQIGFTARFENSEEKAKNWIDNILLPRKDRILFMIYNLNWARIGHLGFSTFNFEEQSCEIDNVVRGLHIGNTKGMMSLAMKAILAWGVNTLQVKHIYLRVLHGNHHAIDFYKRLGFEAQGYIPLYKVVKEDVVDYVYDETRKNEEPDLHYVYMQYMKIEHNE